MANSIISPGRIKVSYVSGADAGNAARALGSVSVTIDNYVAAYVAKFPDATSYAVVPKTTPAPGATVTVNVTIHATDAAGGALPPAFQAFDIQGPPADPLATQIVVSATPTDLAVSSAPADPGSPTAVLM